MHLSELHKQLAYILYLDAEETSHLEQNMPDPMDATQAQWRPSDICDIFGRQRRNYRTQVMEAIEHYKTENKPIPYNELDGE